MYIISTSAIIVNILSVIILIIGLFHNFENPKEKAIYGYLITASMIMYIIALSFVGVYGLAIKHNLYCIILFLCVISPFIIGKLVKYETLKKYTIVQILCYFASLIILLLKV